MSPDYYLSPLTAQMASSGSGPQRAIVRAVRQLLSPEQLSSAPISAPHPALLPTRGTSLHTALSTLGSWWQIHGPFGWVAPNCYL